MGNGLLRICGVVTDESFIPGSAQWDLKSFPTGLMNTDGIWLKRVIPLLNSTVKFCLIHPGVYHAQEISCRGAERRVFMKNLHGS